MKNGRSLAALGMTTGRGDECEKGFSHQGIEMTVEDYGGDFSL